MRFQKGLPLVLMLLAMIVVPNLVAAQAAADVGNGSSFAEFIPETFKPEHSEELMITGTLRLGENKVSLARTCYVVNSDGTQDVSVESRGECITILTDAKSVIEVHNVPGTPEEQIRFLESRKVLAVARLEWATIGEKDILRGAKIDLFLLPQSLD